MRGLEVIGCTPVTSSLPRVDTTLQTYPLRGNEHRHFLSIFQMLAAFVAERPYAASNYIVCIFEGRSALDPTILSFF